MYFSSPLQYGMGKTTTCKALTHRLLELRAQPAPHHWPLPIYLDLRHVGETAKQAPPLRKILDTVLERSWRGGQLQPHLTPEEVLRLLRDENALVICDGLDEVLVHLTPGAGLAFTRELFRLLPPTLAQSARAKTGKLLISCRTHYFRTLREQKTHFTAEDRDGVSAENYRAFVLLPFNQAQILDYLRHSLPDADPQRLLDTLRGIHNLEELAERPYTLSLITAHFPAIEAWKLAGRTVTGVVLYRHMVESWLERDTGKHQLTMTHKQRLMERFAAELWRSGRRAWSVDDLEQWLIDFFSTQPRIAAHYEGVSRELLKEDLRTATFLVREGDKAFRFAHTSLQEFFLAGYLHRALLENRPADWILPMVSPETLDFLGQLLQEEYPQSNAVDLSDAEPSPFGRGQGEGSLKPPHPNLLPKGEGTRRLDSTTLGERGPESDALESGASALNAVSLTFQQLCSQNQPLASSLLLAYALHAWGKNYPCPNTAGMHLEGADLQEWEIQGRADALFDLSGARLRGAQLNQAKLRYVNLDRADLTAVDLSYAELRDSRAYSGPLRQDNNALSLRG